MTDKKLLGLLDLVCERGAYRFAFGPMPRHQVRPTLETYPKLFPALHAECETLETLGLLQRLRNWRKRVIWVPTAEAMRLAPVTSRPGGGGAEERRGWGVRRRR